MNIITGPYIQSYRHAECIVASEGTLCGRVVHLIQSILLLIPVVNSILNLFLETLPYISENRTKPHTVKVEEDPVKEDLPVPKPRRKTAAELGLEVEGDEHPDLADWRIKAEGLISRPPQKDALLGHVEAVFTEGREKGFLLERFGTNGAPIFIGLGVRGDCAVLDRLFALNFITAEMLEMKCKGLGNTSLIWAVANGHFDFASMMIEKSGSTDFINIPSNQNENCAIHLLVSKGYRDVRKDLIQINHSAPEILYQMIERHCNVNVKNIDGLTPAHIAVLKGDDELLAILVHQGRADLAIEDKWGRIPQMLLDLPMKESQELVHTSLSKEMHPLEERKFTEGRQRCREILS